MTATPSSLDGLKERATGILGVLAVLAMPLLGVGAVGALLMSEGEKTRASPSMIPLWASWLVIWWCFTSWVCLLGCLSRLSSRWKQAATLAMRDCLPHHRN
ncbi:MAG: hypothetical protein HQ582_01325 [Planctomycetes bacterium]|nr:hypothetical protein [Planctomycetota bacterium]